MGIRKESLPERLQYFLDGAVESLELDAGSYWICVLYGDPSELAKIIYQPPLMDEVQILTAVREGRILRSLVSRVEICHQLALYANTIFPRLAPSRRSVLIFCSFSGYGYAIQELSRVLSDWALTDSTVGGCLQDLKREKSCLTKQGRPWPRLESRLRSPRFIRKYVKRSDTAQQMRALADITIKRLPLVSAKIEGDVLSDLVKDFRSQSLFIERAKVSRKLNKQRHKLLKRAVIAASAILGGPSVTALARSESVILLGQTVDFQLQRRTSLAELGHGGLDVSVLSKTGETLAHLCVYVDKTPVIEQAAGLALYAAAGLEVDIIRQANVTMLLPAGEKHPLFEGRKHNRAISSLFWSDIDGERRRCEAYWRVTEKLWVQVMRVFVFGRYAYLVPV